MSVLEDTQLFGFPESLNFASTENLKEIALGSIREIYMYMHEQNDWFDALPPYEEEEIEEIPFDIERPTLLGKF